jgi:hypothetical protein
LPLIVVAYIVVVVVVQNDGFPPTMGEYGWGGGGLAPAGRCNGRIQLSASWWLRPVVGNSETSSGGHESPKHRCILLVGIRRRHDPSLVVTASNPMVQWPLTMTLLMLRWFAQGQRVTNANGVTQILPGPIEFVVECRKPFLVLLVPQGLSQASRLLQFRQEGIDVGKNVVEASLLWVHHANQGRQRRGGLDVLDVLPNAPTALVR